jgi:hypothetical protein
MLLTNHELNGAINSAEDRLGHTPMGSISALLDVDRWFQ